MARRSDDFAARNAKLLGLSIDSVFSHLAWIDNIQEKFDVHVDFPVIADVDQHISKLYGMLPKESTTATVRTVFFIDPQGVVRALLAYPATVGRNVDELLRVLDAFNESEANQCAIPANWTKGQPTIVPPPSTQALMEERKKSGGDLKAWYYKENR